MESMQSIVWNPLQDGMESSRRKCTFGDSMRLRRYHTRWRVITYQACGLNNKYPRVKTRGISYAGKALCYQPPFTRVLRSAICILLLERAIWIIYP